VTGVRLMQALTALALALAALLAAGGGLLWLAQRPWFDFEAIELRGDLQHVSVATVRAATAGRLAGNFFTMRLATARRAFEGVPWVAGAAVRRIWPRRLQVTLTEHRAIGVWNDGRLLSDAGVLFVANPEEAEIYGPLLDFAGPAEAAPEAVERLAEFRRVLEPLDLDIARVEVSERRSWAIETAGGSRFELGRDEPPGRIRQQLAAVVAAFPTVLAQFGSAPARIDLRYPNGFAAAMQASDARKP
jgi:cell division protein FtsQ